MPTYDYACEKCDHRFEQFQSITARPLRKCPSCGSQSLKRLIGTGAGIIFKGSGFYETDYRSDSYQKAAQADRTDKAGKTEATGKGASSDKIAASDASSKPATPAATSTKKSADKPPKTK